MNTKFRTTIDPSGRITLPPEIVGELKLKPGAILSIQEKDGRITLEPFSFEETHEETPKLIEKEGILVLHAQLSDDTFKTIEAVRSKRLTELFEDSGK